MSRPRDRGLVACCEQAGPPADLERAARRAEVADERVLAGIVASPPTATFPPGIRKRPTPTGRCACRTVSSPPNRPFRRSWSLARPHRRRDPRRCASSRSAGFFSVPAGNTPAGQPAVRQRTYRPDRPPCEQRCTAAGPGGPANGHKNCGTGPAGTFGPASTGQAAGRWEMRASQAL
jgi:hypothetical protein